MKVKELIEALQELSDDNKELQIIFGDDLGGQIHSIEFVEKHTFPWDTDAGISKDESAIILLSSESGAWAFKVEMD